MKKLFLLVLLTVLSVCAMAQMQRPVIASPPYIFQKYIHVKGSLFSDSTLLASDSTNRVATTAWIKTNVAVHVSGGLSGIGTVGNPIVWGGSLKSTTIINAGLNPIIFNGTNSNFYFSDNSIQLVQVGTGGSNSTVGGYVADKDDGVTIYYKNFGVSSINQQKIAIGGTYTSDKMVITDQIKTLGLINVADYSANERLNQNSLASIGAVKQIADSVKTANPTLYNANGTIASNRTVTIPAATTLTITSSDVNGPSNIFLSNTFAELQSVNGARNAYVQTTPDNGGFATLGINISGSHQGIYTKNTLFGTGTGLLLIDDVDLKGAYYNADYSANYVARSLIDKGYGDSHYATISGATYTASGGITQTGNNFTLGGSLASDVTLSSTVGAQFIVNTAIGSTNGVYTFSAGAFNANVAHSGTLSSQITSNSTNNGWDIKTTNGSNITGVGIYGNSTGGTAGILVKDDIRNVGLIGYASDGVTAKVFTYSGVSSQYVQFGNIPAPAWSSITGTPTTLSGYGITDGVNISRNITIQGNTQNLSVDRTWNVINGTGFVKSSGTTISYDNSTYLTTGTAASTYAPINSPTFTGTVTLPIAFNSLKLNTTAKGVLMSTDGAGTVILQSTNPSGGTGNIVLDGSPSISTPTLVIPTITGGHYYVSGSTSGQITFQTQATSGTYNWNYPTSVGNPGDVLTSNGGGTSAMTWTTLGSNAFTSTAYAPLASPALTGTPTAPTAATADNSTTIATTAYVQANFTANTYYFTPGMFSGAGTAGSNFNWGTATIPASSLSATGTASANTFLSGANTWSAIPIAGINATGTPSSTTYLRGDGTWATVSSGSSGANPTASVGLSAVNGSATTFMRSDAAPAIDQTIAPTWTGVHTFSVTNTASSGSNYGLKITNTVNQTGTAAFTDLFVNRTNTASGSGGQYLIDLQVGSSSKFNVNTGGFITTPSGIGLGGASNIGFFSTSGTFSQDALTLVNNAVAASGTPSLNSPRFHYLSTVWNTTPTAAANYANVITEMRTVSGTTPTFALYWAGNLSTSSTPGTFTDLMKLDNSSNLSLLNTISTKHIIGSSSAPSIAAGTGAGTSPTVVISAGGTDMSGVISVSTGTSPAGSNAVIATVTFNTAYGSAPKVVIHPGNSVTAALSGAQYVFTPALAQPNGPTTTTFSIVSGSTALAASTAYYWTYEVMQ